MLNTMRRSERVLAWRENVRTFRIASWLGWQIESNWTDPLAFFIFTILRPMAAALIVVVMYQVIAGGARTAFFDYLFISNAFFVLVIGVMSGMAWAVLEDREEYKMLKYIYTSPARQFAYLVGRAVAKTALGLLTTFILLTTGVLFLGLHMPLDRVAWGWFAVYFLLGLVILASLGIVLGGVALVVARNGSAIGEVSAGMILLFSSAYFPPDILPPVIREISLVIPVTYWLEGMRRALAGGILEGTITTPQGTITGPISPFLARWDNWQLLAILVVCAILSALVSLLFYRWVEHQAKERGMIDRITGF